MNIQRISRALVSSLLLVCATLVVAEDKAVFGVEPVTKQGKRWRIGYYEGGPYIDYQRTLRETVRGLMKLGWLEPVELPPPEGARIEPLWQWLATHVRSDYIEFVADAYYSANWNETRRQAISAILLERLSRKQDLDLVIAMGTWAGKDLANDQHRTPTMVLSASDPLSAGIIASVEDSGHEHVHARVDPYLFERQIRIFHDIVGFKRLGVAYENSVDGRSYAAVDAIEKVSKERGFVIEHCHTLSDISDVRKAEQSVLDCFDTLARTADAIYVTQQGGINSTTIPALVDITNRHNIPTFSQAGAEEVRYGFLVSLSDASFRYVGEFHALTFAKVFNGARPNQLEQLFEAPPKIAINLRTAEQIGFIPPLILLGAVDEIHREIELPR